MSKRWFALGAICALALAAFTQVPPINFNDNWFLRTDGQIVLNPATVSITTPPSCDGFSAQDGAITTGTATFTSASANFPSNVASPPNSRKISINGAGATQYFGNATISAGGSGYAVGDTIVLSGGTGTAATVVVRSLTGSAVATVAGLAGSLGSYTVVPSNAVTQASTSGAGTGATFNVTWLRDNLVTTISSRNSATEVTIAANASATVSGALWGYGSVYTTQINTAVATGNATQLPQGWCGIDNTVIIDSKQKLAGIGVGGSGVGPSNLLWLGAAGGTMLKADTASIVNGAVVGPFNLMGLGAASIGGHFRGLQQSRVDLHVTAVKDWGVKLEEASVSSPVSDTYFNDFRLQVAVNTPYPASRNAVGIGFPKALVSSGAHDVNGNNFYNTAVYHQDGIGIDLDEGYMNNFYLTQLFGTGNGWGVRFGGSSVGNTLRAHGNNFYDFISQAPILAEGGTFPSLGNTIDPFDTQAFNPTVTIQSGATLYCVTNGTSSNAGDRGKNKCTAPANHQATAAPGSISDLVDYRVLAVGTFVPRYTGNMTLWAAGAATNDANGQGGLITIYYGTGTPPVFNDVAATAGTARFNCGGFPGMRNPVGLTMTAGVAVKCDVPEFARGTTWWYALTAKAIGGGNFSVANVYISAKEDP